MASKDLRESFLGGGGRLLIKLVPKKGVCSDPPPKWMEKLELQQIIHLSLTTHITKILTLSYLYKLTYKEPPSPS